MKNSTYNTIKNVLATIDFEGKDAVMEELDKELNRGAEEKAIKNAEYETAWLVIREVLESTTTPLTATEIFERCKENLPDNFSRGRVQYGLNNTWKDVVVKIEGKPNTYRLA